MLLTSRLVGVPMRSVSLLVASFNLPAANESTRWLIFSMARSWLA